jgi:hypothetical protein
MVGLAFLDHVGEIMRHQVNCLKGAKSWAVIDARTGYQVFSFINKKEASITLDGCEKYMLMRLCELYL